MRESYMRERYMRERYMREIYMRERYKIITKQEKKLYLLLLL
jgi:hypothetical protein